MICRLDNICSESCDKFCSLCVGYSLARFLREVDTLETRIGEIADGSEYAKSKYMIAGVQVDKQKNPTHIFGDMSVSIDISRKFGMAFNKTAMALLNEYIKVSNAEDGAELKDKLRKIEGNKLLLMPIKPEVSCEIVVEVEEEGKLKTVTKNTIVESVKWMNNPQTKLLECTLITDIIEGVHGKRAKIKLESYGEQIRLLDVERSVSSTDADSNVIKMSRLGYIKPIAVIDKKKNGIIVDNTYMYMIDGDNIKIIAYWNMNTLVGDTLFEEMSKTATFKKIKKNLTYIGQHRRYIAPYGLVECNTIEI